jgi:hypothetical protein
MPLFEELKTTLEAYVDGRVPLSDLRRWLAEHVQEVAEREDPVLYDVNGLAWTLLAEYDYGHIDEGRLRDELREGMPNLQDVYIDRRERPVVRSDSVTVTVPMLPVELDLRRPAPIADIRFELAPL